MTLVRALVLCGLAFAAGGTAASAMSPGREAEPQNRRDLWASDFSRLLNVKHPEIVDRILAERGVRTLGDLMTYFQSDPATVGIRLNEISERLETELGTAFAADRAAEAAARQRRKDPQAPLPSASAPTEPAKVVRERYSGGPGHWLRHRLATFGLVPEMSAFETDHWQSALSPLLYMRAVPREIFLGRPIDSIPFVMPDESTRYLMRAVALENLIYMDRPRTARHPNRVIQAGIEKVHSLMENEYRVFLRELGLDVPTAQVFSLYGQPVPREVLRRFLHADIRRFFKNPDGLVRSFQQRWELFSLIDVIEELSRLQHRGVIGDLEFSQRSSHDLADRLNRSLSWYHVPNLKTETFWMALILPIRFLGFERWLDEEEIAGLRALYPSDCELWLREPLADPEK